MAFVLISSSLPMGFFHRLSSPCCTASPNQKFGITDNRLLVIRVHNLLIPLVLKRLPTFTFCSSFSSFQSTVAGRFMILLSTDSERAFTRLSSFLPSAVSLSVSRSAMRSSMRCSRTSLGFLQQLGGIGFQVACGFICSILRTTLKQILFRIAFPEYCTVWFLCLCLIKVSNVALHLHATDGDTRDTGVPSVLCLFTCESSTMSCASVKALSSSISVTTAAGVESDTGSNVVIAENNSSVSAGTSCEQTLTRAVYQ